jgi:hypothetical protein
MARRQRSGVDQSECLRWIDLMRPTEPDEEEREAMATPRDETPILEEPDPLDPEDAAEIAPLDSAVDFDDEQEEDQVPLDETEAAEAGVLLDDPGDLSDEDE